MGESINIDDFEIDPDSIPKDSEWEKRIRESLSGTIWQIEGEIRELTAQEMLSLHWEKV